MLALLLLLLLGAADQLLCAAKLVTVGDVPALRAAARPVSAGGAEMIVIAEHLEMRMDLQRSSATKVGLAISNLAPGEHKAIWGDCASDPPVDLSAALLAGRPPHACVLRARAEEAADFSYAILIDGNSPRAAAVWLSNLWIVHDGNAQLQMLNHARALTSLDTLELWITRSGALHFPNDGWSVGSAKSVYMTDCVARGNQLDGAFISQVHRWVLVNRCHFDSNGGATNASSALCIMALTERCSVALTGSSFSGNEGNHASCRTTLASNGTSQLGSAAFWHDDTLTLGRNHVCYDPATVLPLRLALLPTGGLSALSMVRSASASWLRRLEEAGAWGATTVLQDTVGAESASAGPLVAVIVCGACGGALLLVALAALIVRLRHQHVSAKHCAEVELARRHSSEMHLADEVLYGARGATVALHMEASACNGRKLLQKSGDDAGFRAGELALQKSDGPLTLHTTRRGACSGNPYAERHMALGGTPHARSATGTVSAASRAPCVDGEPPAWVQPACASCAGRPAQMSLHEHSTCSSGRSHWTDPVPAGALPDPPPCFACTADGDGTPASGALPLSDVLCALNCISAQLGGRLHNCDIETTAVRKEGEHSVVVLARESCTLKSVAVKLFADWRHFERELSLYSCVLMGHGRSDFIISAEENAAEVLPNGSLLPSCIVMQRGEPLSALLTQPRTASQLCALLLCLSEQLAAAHVAGFAHGRVCPEHILWISELHEWRLISWSGSQTIGCPIRKQATGPYAAPELVSVPGGIGPPTSCIGPAADVYALGAVAMELLQVHARATQSSQTEPIVGKLTLLQQGQCESPWNDGGLLVDLLQKMVRHDPSERPTARCVGSTARSAVHWSATCGMTPSPLFDC